MDVESGGSRWGLYMECERDQTVWLAALSTTRICSMGRSSRSYWMTGRPCWKHLPMSQNRAFQNYHGWRAMKDSGSQRSRDLVKSASKRIDGIAGRRRFLRAALVFATEDMASGTPAFGQRRLQTTPCSSAFTELSAKTRYGCLFRASFSARDVAIRLSNNRRQTHPDCCSLRGVGLACTDLSGLPDSARDARAQQLALEEAMHPFDLARGRCFGAVTRLAPNDHVLQLTTHHLVYDDWSTGILIHELSRSYQGFVAGTAPREESPSYQYGDFVRGLEERFHGAVLESELAFWKQQLSSPNGFQAPSLGPRAPRLRPSTPARGKPWRCRLR